MSEIKALEKLRDELQICETTGARPTIAFVSTIADEIEAEIAENYMLLPVDADGVPIHVGDLMRARDWCEDRRVDSFAVVCRSSDGCYGVWHNADELTHANPRTLEDIVQDAIQYGYSHGKAVMEVSEQRDKYADEIRELLLGGDAS